jgi:hypothetical protein
MSSSPESVARCFGRRHTVVPRLVGLLLACVAVMTASAGMAQSASVGGGGGDSALVSPVAGGELKSETTALLWSFLGTALPAAASAPFVWTPTGNSEEAAIVLVGALVIGPSLGHFYAERSGPAFAGIGIRVLAGAAIVAAAGYDYDNTSSSQYETLAIAGAIVGGASIMWDILRAPHSASVYNEKARPGGVSIRITPSVGAAGPGLRAAATF